MKTKSKMFIAVLIGCALVLASTVCAGCTGSDPIVGTYVHTFSDGSIVNDFHNDGTFDTYAVYNDGCVEKQEPFSWKKTGDNRYESGLVIYKLSDDGYTLTETPSSGKILEYTKYSNYKIPEVTPKDTLTYKEHQMIGTWQLYANLLNYMRIKLESGNTGTIDICSNGKSTVLPITWKYTESSSDGQDLYALISNLGIVTGILGHYDGKDTCGYLIAGGNAIQTLTRV